MADELQIKISDGPHGKLAIINGKTYALLRYYESNVLEGVFSLWPDAPCSVPTTSSNTGVCSAAGARVPGAERPPVLLPAHPGRQHRRDAPHWPKLKSPSSWYALWTDRGGSPDPDPADGGTVSLRSATWHRPCSGRMESRTCAADLRLAQQG